MPTRCRTRYAEPGAVDQVGYSADELRSMTMLDLSPEFDQQKSPCGLPRSSGPWRLSSVMFTTVHRHRDGSDVPVEIILQASDIEDGRPSAYVKIVREHDCPPCR